MSSSVASPAAPAPAARAGERAERAAGAGARARGAALGDDDDGGAAIARPRAGAVTQGPRCFPEGDFNALLQIETPNEWQCRGESAKSVSYTHLTLPTILLV